jgi:hypothetical protein
MPLIKICAYEVTSFDPVLPITVTCNDPCFKPVAPGNQCNVCCYDAKLDLSATPPTLCFSYDAQFEYAYLGKRQPEKDEATPGCACSCTFLDFCNVTGQSVCITLPAGVTLCPCGCGEPKVTCSATCDPGSIETTHCSVSGQITISLHVSNLCDPTTVCVETESCCDDRIKYYLG